MAVHILAEMVANVWRVCVSEGDTVTEEDVIMILESMKMEIPITPTSSGRVAALHVSEGDVVQEGQKLVTIEPAT